MVGNFHPHFKLLPKYSLHEDTFHIAIQQETCTVIQDPNFQDNWDDLKNHPQDPAQDMAEDPFYEDNVKSTDSVFKRQVHTAKERDRGQLGKVKFRNFKLKKMMDDEVKPDFPMKMNLHVDPG